MIAPEVIEEPGAPPAAEEPEIAAAVGPSYGTVLCSRRVACRANAYRAKGPRLVRLVTPAYPGPLLGRRVELPKIAKIAIRAHRIDTLAAEQP